MIKMCRCLSYKGEAAVNMWVQGVRYWLLDSIVTFLEQEYDQYLPSAALKSVSLTIFGSL